jgi:hypothetical protein
MATKRALSPSTAESNRPSKISAALAGDVDGSAPVVAPVSSLLVKRVSDKGRLPTRGSPLAAGYDLYR